MRSWLAILVTLAACNDPNVDRLTAIKDNVCACKTASCAEQEMKLVPQGAIKSTHRIQEIARDLLDCLARLQAAERPATDPDAEDTAESPGTPPPSTPPPSTLPPGTPPPSTLPPPSAPRTAAPASARTR